MFKAVSACIYAKRWLQGGAILFLKRSFKPIAVVRWHLYCFKWLDVDKIIFAKSQENLPLKAKISQDIDVVGSEARHFSFELSLF